jgi:hypothetical protein
MDTRSLVTIILIAAIFGVIRLAGGGAGERTVLPHGGVKRSVNKQYESNQKVPAPIEFKGRFDSANPVDDLKVISKRAGQPVEQDDLLGEIVNQPPPQRKTAVDNSKKPGAKLDDIARSMGIK